MSYKSALAGMPVGGGKSVIIGGTYATGEDVGMSVADIDTVAEVMPFVGGTSGGAGDPSVHTAVGCVHGLRRRRGMADRRAPACRPCEPCGR
jgi:leucine dehydrogenase